MDQITSQTGNDVLKSSSLTSIVTRRLMSVHSVVCVCVRVRVSNMAAPVCQEKIVRTSERVY